MSLLDMLKDRLSRERRNARQIAAIRHELEAALPGKIEDLLIECRGSEMVLKGRCDTFETQKRALQIVTRSATSTRIKNHLTIRLKK